MKFMVKTTELKSIADDISEESSSITELCSRIWTVKRTLQSFQGVGMDAVCSCLGRNAINLQKQKRNVKKLGTALQNVALQYESTEQAILSGDISKIQKREGGDSVVDEVSDILETGDGSVSDQEKDSVIEEYERTHEEQAQIFDEYLDSCEPNPLTEEDIRNIKYLVYTAEEPFRSMYLDSLSKYKINTMSLDEGAYYRPWDHEVNYKYPDSFSEDPRGAYTTFFHESGHAIDDLSDHNKWLGSDTEKIKYYSEDLGKEITLREAIEYDVYRNPNNPHSITSIANEIIDSGKSGKNGNIDNVIEAFQSGSKDGLSKEDLKLYNAVKNEYQRTTGNDATYEAVTDVYGGVSNNELRNNGYGHETTYWEDDTKAGKELWAEYFSYNMAGDQENLDNLYEYFPEASKMLDQYAASFE